MKNSKHRIKYNILSIMLSFLILISGILPVNIGTNEICASEQEIDLNAIPDYSGEPYIVINDNVPNLSISDAEEGSFEQYSSLDELGRCGTAYANIGIDLMPTEERGSIGSVKPSGWHTVKYDNVDGKYLYNRCHLIGYQLSGENANSENLITGTRYLNIEGMLPFENMVTDYIKETGNHVLYRVTPIFKENNLIASGVHMEAVSAEDDGEGIMYNVYCYNVQPGIVIDYATGDSYEDNNNNVDFNIVDNTPNTTTYTAIAKVNVRSAETTESEVLGQIEYGAHAEVISVSGEWAKILFCDQPAYVAAAYLVEGSSLPQQEVVQQPVEESVVVSQTEEPVQQQASEAMVWIPNSGKKYHSRKGCSNMKNPTQVTIDQAISMGYEPCKKCY